MNLDLFSVQDQVVVVAGGSRGIGRAIAEGFALRGAQVIIAGRDRASLDAAGAAMAGSAGRVRAVPFDVADIESIRRLVDAVRDEFGRIDTLVNSAGVNRRMLSEHLTEDDFDHVLGVNLRGAFWLARAVGRHMVARGSGSQIHITSLSADRPPLGLLPYAASKAGLTQVVKELALEWGPRGVRVNAIAPGFIVTDLNRKIWSDPAMIEWGHANTPLGRTGKPEDVAGAAIFLASQAAAFITGVTIVVDGGFSCGVAWPIRYDPPGG